MTRAAALARDVLPERLQRLLGDAKRLRELAVASLIVAFVAWWSPSITYSYATVFTGLATLLVLVVMIENQEKTLYLLLFFSSVYYVFKAVFLGWGGLSFVFKEGFLAMLVAFWIFHLVLRSEKVRHTPLNRPVLALVGWLVLECFNPNTGPFFTVIDDFRFWIGPIAVFFLTAHLVDDRRKLERGLKVVFVYASLEAVYGLLQQWMPGDWLVALGANPNSYFFFHHGSIRSFSTMGTTGFSIFAAMFPPLAFFYMSQRKDLTQRLFFAALAFVFVAGVIFTLVRTGWIALGVSLLAYALLTRRYYLVVAVLVVVLLVGTLASGYMALKVHGMLNPEEDASIQTRLGILGLVGSGPFLRVFGYGLGTFSHNRFGYAMAGSSGYGTATENWYLLAALELGWIGVFLVGWIGFKAYGMGFRMYRGGLKTRRYRELAASLICANLAVEVARLGGPAGYYPPDAWHYWFFFGLLMVLPKADEELAALEAAAARAPTPGTVAAAAAPSPARVPA